MAQKPETKTKAGEPVTAGATADTRVADEPMPTLEEPGSTVAPAPLPNTQPLPGRAKLFKLSPAEAQQLEARFAAHQKDAGGQSAAQQQALARRRELFAELLRQHPPEPDMQVWRHEHLGEAAYTEVAINGGYFDPRTVAPSYRPDLDIPDFTNAEPVGEAVIKM